MCLTFFPVTQKEVQMLMKRYAAYDNSDRGIDGITLADCLTMSEFMGNKFAASIAEAHLDGNTHRIHPKAFLSVLSLLSSKTPAEVKKNCKWCVCVCVCVCTCVCVLSLIHI